MPELPEVETLARGLRTHIVGKTITKVIVHEAKKFKGTPVELRKYVLKRTVSAVDRKAKWLVLKLSSGYSFVIHLKMTGQLLYQKKEPLPLPNNHTRVQFMFSDKTQLFFQDMRKFGYVELYSPTGLAEYFIKKRPGIEPIQPTFTFAYFNQQLKSHGNTSLKAVLLNQQLIGGIGNIYSDDICWQAKVKPMRRVKTLTLSERKAIHVAARTILQEAIKLGGTSFSHFYSVTGKQGSYWNHRKVYQRVGEPCLRCGSIIKKTRCAGRGTCYCSGCQK
ncbi:MAG: bifunctional DNA-formamidopyrimidine glycosylase/DNA-(apurinic or apyrimidinic site) lyase [Patescibacteria group bacterium]